MQEVSTAEAWGESLDLAAAVARVCDEFSDAERNVLVGHLRQLVVDIPTSVAADLKAKRTPSQDPVMRLRVVLALIEKIYPAIETTQVETKLQQLEQRLAGDFTAQKPDAGDEPVAALAEQPVSVSRQESPDVERDDLAPAATTDDDHEGEPANAPLIGTPVSKPVVSVPITNQD